MKSVGRTISQAPFVPLVSALTLALALGAGFAAPPAFADDSAAPPAAASTLPAAPAPAAPAAATPAPPPLAAAPANSGNSGMTDKVAQENLFWESAQKSNTAADYKAYLDAFPNGLYAPLARNRIAALAQPQPAPPANEANAPQQGGPAQQGQGQGEQANAPNGPGQGGPDQGEQQANAPQGQEGPGQQGGMQQGPPPDAIRAEIGTPATEAALGLNRPDLKEIQRRLNVLGLYQGGIDGDFGPGTRGAIAEWQRREGAQPTGMLGPIQLQALRAQSGPVVGQRAEGGNCPTGFHSGPYGRRCWPNR